MNPYYDDCKTACHEAYKELLNYKNICAIIDVFKLEEKWLKVCNKKKLDYFFNSTYHFNVFTLCGITAYAKRKKYDDNSTQKKKMYLERLDLCFGKLKNQENIKCFKNKLIGLNDQNFLQTFSELLIAEFLYDNKCDLIFNNRFEVELEDGTIKKPDFDIKSVNGKEVYLNEVYTCFDTVETGDDAIFMSDDISQNSLFRKIEEKITLKFYTKEKGIVKSDEGKIILVINVNYADSVWTQLISPIFKQNLIIIKEKIELIKTKYPFISQIVLFSLTNDNPSLPISFLIT